MGQLGIRIANLTLFVAGCFLTANIINQIGGAMLRPDYAVPPPPPVTQVANKPAWSTRQPILDRNVFESGEDETPVAIEVDESEDIEDTKLPLRLLGTIASVDPRAASAAIEDERTREHEVVQVGDTLQNHSGVEVLKIERKSVILLNGSNREVLKLDEETAAAPAPAPRQVASRQRRRSRRQRPAQVSAEDRLRQMADEAGARSPAAIFSQARILPKYEDGQMVGIQLSKIKPDSFYEKVGLEDGDVVQSLNGVAIDNPSASKELLDAFTSADEMTVDVVRNGVKTQISVGPDTLQELGLR